MTNGVMRRYGTDALGSVVATYKNGVQENTYRYKPYGGLLAKIGAAVDPSFIWNGGSGYRNASTFVSQAYVRNRHFDPSLAQWISVDRLWPDETAYAYAKCSPSQWTDPTGLKPSCCCHIDSAQFYITSGKAAQGVYSQATLSGQATNQSPTHPPDAGGCVLHWWEKTNHPTLPGAPTNTWYEVTDAMTAPKPSPNYAFQGMLPTGCPGTKWPVTKSFSLTDNQKVPWTRSFDRILCVKPKLFWTTDGCSGWNSSVFLVWQVVSCDSGGNCSVSDSNHSINFKADLYCMPQDGGTWP
jgi:RHS repeat-associated protein